MVFKQAVVMDTRCASLRVLMQNEAVWLKLRARERSNNDRPDLKPEASLNPCCSGRLDRTPLWLLPVLLIPKPLNPALWFNHSMFMGFYLLSFLLERKPCTICALVFLAALFLICYSCWGNCFLYHCHGSPLPDSAHDPSIVGT
ncbi:bladder cancer-associated protein [Arapaima gigas]